MKIRIFLSIIFILAGVLIYSFYRQDVFFLKPFSGILPSEFCHNTDFNIICQFLLFNLPDALWCAALFLLQPNPLKEGWNVLIIISILLPFLHEILQGINLLPGTFDLLDLTLYVIIFIIFLIIWKKEKDSRKAEVFNYSA